DFRRGAGTSTPRLPANGSTGTHRPFHSRIADADRCRASHHEWSRCCLVVPSQAIGRAEESSDHDKPGRSGAARLRLTSRPQPRGPSPGTPIGGRSLDKRRPPRYAHATLGLMTPEQLPLLAAAVLLVAFLYSSVGHAGASGYIAVMSLFSLAPGIIKPTALLLNILVASIGAWQCWRAGHFSWRLFWAFALLSFPAAFLGGYINLPTHVFKAAVGLVLWFSAARFLLQPGADDVVREPSRPAAISIGAGLGLLSGLTGTGGGIFLTPLLLIMRWARTKTAAAVSALFILVNSGSGLLGN